LSREQPTQNRSRWHIPAAFAAWVLPGLGHAVLGEHRRGLILFGGIGLLWLSGLLIGGVSVCDRYRHSAWFLGQVLVAPSLAVNHYQQYLKRQPDHPPMPGEAHDYEPSYGHMSEQGVLFTALAGLLNLLAMIDVIYRDPSDRRVTGQVATAGQGAGAGRHA